MKRIIGIGNALVDILTLIPNEELLETLNLPKGSMQLVDFEFANNLSALTSGLSKSMASGGSAANTIHGLARLGVETAFIGHVGQDETGEFFQKDMKSAGIRPLLFTSNSPSGIANALITPDGERTFATFLGAAIELSADHLQASLFEGYDLLYVEGYLVQNEALLLKAMQLAKACGLQVALDLASYNVVEANKLLLEKVLNEYVDIVFANEEEARALSGLPPLESLDQLADKCSLAIVKTGAKGSMAKSGSQKIEVGVIKANPIDTTGAGDLYAAGFLHAYLNGKSLETACHTGALLAGKVIEVIGPKMDDLTWENIRKHISKI